MSDESIRPMTDEERQRAKERSDANKECNDVNKERSDANKECNDVNKERSDVDKECNDVNKERSDVDKERSDVGAILIQEVIEHEDGSATYTFDMDEKAHKKLAELGLELAMTCVAYEMDIQEAMAHVRWLGVAKEVNEELYPEKSQSVEIYDA